jgi:N-acetylmuramoyl-L-alanine amidase
MKVCIQAGHVNIAKNSIAKLRSSTGAPNEQKFNLSIRDGLSKYLSKYDIECYKTDGNANDDPLVRNVEWDLFLSIHFDADIYKDSGGFVDFPDPLKDQATKESQRIAKLISSSYFRTTGIKNISRSNANTKYYYMWEVLSAKTPCVLIECGVGNRKPNDYETLFNKQDLVVKGIGEGILDAFGINPNAISDITLKVDEMQKQSLDLTEEAKYLKATTEDLIKRLKNHNDCITTLKRIVEKGG